MWIFSQISYINIDVTDASLYAADSARVLLYKFTYLLTFSPKFTSMVIMK